MIKINKRILFFVLFLLNPSLQAQEIIAGQVSVIDGDTLKIGTVKIRLLGIDAPDKGKTAQSVFYEQSKQALATFIGQQQITCRPTGDKSYDRIVASCFLGKKDIAEYMVEIGFAVDWPKFSKGIYADEMQFAVRNKVGMWGILSKSWR
jgi:endonuclease YncB( thermonuclease family)